MKKLTPAQLKRAAELLDVLVRPSDHLNGNDGAMIAEDRAVSAAITEASILFGYYRPTGKRGRPRSFYGIHKPVIAALLLFLCGSCCTTYRVHVQDSADSELRGVLVERDSKILDLAAAGKQLVAHYGRRVAWQTVLNAWAEQTGGAPLSRAGDVLWLADQSAHIQCVAWLIQFKDQWL